MIREVSSNRPITTMVVLGGCVSFFVGTAFQATMPEFAHDLGTDKADFAYSALLGANAAGAVVGGFLLEGRSWLPPNVKTAFIERDPLVRRHRGVRTVVPITIYRWRCCLSPGC